MTDANEWPAWTGVTVYLVTSDSPGWNGVFYTFAEGMEWAIGCAEDGAADIQLWECQMGQTPVDATPRPQVTA